MPTISELNKIIARIKEVQNNPNFNNGKGKNVRAMILFHILTAAEKFLLSMFSNFPFLCNLFYFIGGHGQFVFGQGGKDQGSVKNCRASHSINGGGRRRRR
jgi:hypothetical protein